VIETGRMAHLPGIIGSLLRGVLPEKVNPLLLEQVLGKFATNILEEKLSALKRHEHNSATPIK
jgi:hypothetical protein